jgi:hypothetical protein
MNSLLVGLNVRKTELSVKQKGRLAHPSSPAFDNADLIGRRGQSKDLRMLLIFFSLKYIVKK